MVESSPAVAGGVVYFGSDDGKVYAVRAVGQERGTLLWSATTGSPVYAAPVVANGKVFVGSQDEVMYAYDAHSGSLQWAVATAGIVRTAAVANGVVYAVSDDDTLYAFAASGGGLLTTTLTGRTFLGGPAVSDGVLYANAYGGSLSAFALSAGTDAPRAARPPVLAALHPDMSLAVTPQSAITWADPDDE